MSQRNTQCSLYRTFVVLLVFNIIATVIILFLWNYHGRSLDAESSQATLVNPRYGRQFDSLPCRLPVLDPFDVSIKGFIRKAEYWKCPEIPSVVYVDEDNILRVNSSALGFFGLNNPSDLKCTAEVVYRRHIDKKAGFRQAVHVTPPVNLTTDFTRVRCKNGSDTVFDNIVAAITDFLRVGNIPVATETDDQLSVFMLGIDSLSRSGAIRTIPKTLAYLKYIRAYDFEGHMTVGKNTLPNMFPLLTGIRLGGRDDPIPKLHMDDWPFLWKNFSEKGYATLYADDYSDNSIFYSYGMKGFVKLPVDHYMRPFWLALRDSDAFSDELTHKSKFYKFNKERKYTSYMCNQNTFQYMNLLNYIKRFMLHYKGRRKFLFSFLGELNHHSTSHLNGADDDLRDFFVWLHDNGFLNRMVVAFFGDHGFRFGSVRSTYIGRLEASLPMLQLLVPDRTKQTYPDIETCLTRNTKRLTSNFDLRQTFLDVLNKNFKHPSKGDTRGLSLFGEIPESRSCAEAGILAHLCTCVTSRDSAIKNDSFVMKVADHIVKHINNILENASDCEEVKLCKIKSVEVLYLKPKQDVHTYSSKTATVSPLPTKKTYSVVIETKPGKAKFETMFEIDGPQGKYTFIDVDRINAYGNQSYCVEAAKLKPYCYCKGYK